MKFYNSILTFFLCFYSLVVFSQQKEILIDKEKSNLEEVINILETDFGYFFSYKIDDVKNEEVRLPKIRLPIDQFLVFILKPTKLDFEIVQNNFIILKLKKTSTNLGNIPPPDKFLLCGKIIDEYSGEPLPFANIFLQKQQQGTVTDENGSFELFIEESIKDTAILSFVGYQEIRIATSDFKRKPCPTFSLKYFEFSDNFIVVKDYLTSGITLEENGAFTQINPSQIKVLPGQAEPDVLRTIQFLPGISSPDGSAASICIRGGTPDQNLILWEDIPIYHSAHYFGNLSAFNPNIIDQARIFRGGFNSEYGGRISGVIDLKTVDLQSDDQTRLGVGVNFIDANADGKLVFWKNKAALTFSVRRSIADLWPSPTFEKFSQRIHRGILFQTPTNAPVPENIMIDDEFHFYDSNIKASVQLTEKDKLSFAGFYGENDFQSILNNQMRNQIQDDSLVLENEGWSLSWERKWNSRFTSKIIGLISDYHYQYEYRLIDQNGLLNPNNREGNKSSRINEKQFHWSNNFKLRKGLDFKFGYQFNDYDVGFQITKQNRENEQANQSKDYDSNVHTGYVSFNTSKEKKLGLELGLRSSYLESESQNYFEPRLKVWYKLSSNFSLNLNAGKYYQFLSQLEQIEGDRASIETPVWVLAGQREVPILDANQLQMGLVFNKDGWLLDIQSYYKNINGLTSLATGFDEDFKGRFHLGNAKIKGLDILLKKRWKNFSSWISYTLSNVSYEFDSFFDQEFNAAIDQPHNFHWVNLWTYKKLEFSLGWKIVSGTPYSLKENFRIQIDQGMNGPKERIVPIIEEYNSERLPARHQLDASILYKFSSTGSNSWNGKIGVSFFNIYNQSNIYNRGFFMDIRPNILPRLEYTDQLELGFTPNFVFRIEL